MVKRFLLLASATAALALSSVLMAGPSSAYDGPAVPIASDLAPLQEFSTPGSAGWFWTLNGNEAATAVSKYKFTKTANIGSLHTTPVPGSVAVHRLRLKNGGPSYMLSISQSEFTNPEFADEGVLGYIDSSQHPGEVRLLRYSNNNKWRVLAEGPANQKNITAEGYHLDGPVGWYHS